MAFNIFESVVGDPLRSMGIEGSELPIVGGLFDNPADQAYQDALARNAEMLQQYRGPAIEARGQALQQQLGALGPANNMLGAMYGPGARVDLQALGQNPFAGLANETSLTGGQGARGGFDGVLSPGVENAMTTASAASLPLAATLAPVYGAEKVGEWFGGLF